jgi:sulfur-oxidizing protein SoxA
VHTFACLYECVEVFRAELFPAITANPFVAFTTIAIVSGTLAFRFTDAAANPGMLAVRTGEQLWATPVGAAQRACADCHQDARQTMRGVAPMYPRWDERSARPVDLSMRVALCRSRHQQIDPGTPEDPQRLALTAYVAHLSRGLPVHPDPDPRLVPARKRGRVQFVQRIGQLSLSCADCHDTYWGQRLGSSTIPQGHANGYPLYRLEWQALGSLQRRLRGCLTGVRAELWPADAAQYVELELYLQQRGAGLPLEVPAVRP